jgi:hypothetical protein
MLTRDGMHRMGMHACGSVLDYNLSRMIVMIIEMTVPIRSEDTWDLRGLFHAMIQIEEYNSDNGEESLDQ